MHLFIKKIIEPLYLPNSNPLGPIKYDFVAGFIGEEL